MINPSLGRTEVHQSEEYVEYGCFERFFVFGGFGENIEEFDFVEKLIEISFYGLNSDERDGVGLRM